MKVWTHERRTFWARFSCERKWALGKRGAGAKAKPRGTWTRQVLAEIRRQSYNIIRKQETPWISQKPICVPAFRITSDIYYPSTTDFSLCKWKPYTILELLFRDVKLLVHIIINSCLCECLLSSKKKSPNWLLPKEKKENIHSPLSGWKERHSR